MADEYYHENTPENMGNNTADNTPNQNAGKPEKKQEEAGCLGIGFSFLCPLIGFIIYFVNKDNVKNPSSYLYAAFGGIGFVILMQIFAAIANS